MLKKEQLEIRPIEKNQLLIKGRNYRKKLKNQR